MPFAICFGRRPKSSSVSKGERVERRFSSSDSLPQISSSASSLVLALLREEIPLEEIIKEEIKQAAAKADDGCCLCFPLNSRLFGNDVHSKYFLKNLRPFDGYKEYEIGNYLYNKSKEIEPKNIRKPLVKERRWPNISLKSPGIKPRSSRSVPNPLPSMFGSGHKSSEGIEGDETPNQLTPPTPSTPGTPPSSGNPADNSIFATVEIGPGAVSYRGSISGASTISDMTGNLFPVPPTPGQPISPHTPHPPSMMPPPLPPRRRRDLSQGDISPKVKQAPDAPELPPRDPSPPPIPPRVSTATLPRMHHSTTNFNMTGQPPPPYPIPSHLHYNSFMAAPSHLQYRLDAPPQRRRTSSMDLSASQSSSSLIQTNPSPGDPLLESRDRGPPTPPPRLVPRQPAMSFPYDQHNF